MFYLIIITLILLLQLLQFTVVKIFVSKIMHYCIERFAFWVYSSEQGRMLPDFIELVWRQSTEGRPENVQLRDHTSFMPHRYHYNSEECCWLHTKCPFVEQWIGLSFCSGSTKAGVQCWVWARIYITVNSLGLSNMVVEPTHLNDDASFTFAEMEVC